MLKTKEEKVKVSVPLKFLRHTKEGTVKKKYKVRVPSTFLKKAVKRKVASKHLKKNLAKLRKKKKVAKESECPTSQKKSSSTLSAVKRLVRLKRKAKVHPITSTK